MPLELSQIVKFFFVTKTLILTNKKSEWKTLNKKSWKHLKDCSRQFNFFRTIFTVTKFWTTIEKKTTILPFEPKICFVFYEQSFQIITEVFPFFFFFSNQKGSCWAFRLSSLWLIWRKIWALLNDPLCMDGKRKDSAALTLGFLTITRFCHLIYFVVNAWVFQKWWDFTKADFLS